jgi:hypothetical protein
MADPDTPEQLELQATTAGTPPAVAAPAAPSMDAVTAEFNRRFGTLDDRLNTVVQYIASREQQQAPAPPPQPPSQDPMDQLWQRAQQGDKQAFDTWVTARTQQTLAQQQAVQNDEAITDGQLRILLQRYPALNDATNPLTQAANLAFQLMTRHGKPATKATLLDAAKTAIADRPDLVAQMHASTARERSRQGTIRQGQMGAGYRDSEPGQLPAGRKLSVSPESQQLAKRMGVKDPLKAKQNFLKRQEDGQSSLGAVAAFVREDEF